MPTSTYRVQVHADFDLDAVAGIVDHLADLGVDWVYLSPLLAAEPGSNHGYDVIDHHVVDAARGGRDALVRLADAAHARGLGVVVDIVPNHVGVATPVLNEWWWDVLQHGETSSHAAAFDVDWPAGDGRLRLPVLGDDGATALRVEDGELRYHELRLPLAPGSADDGAAPAVVHGRQHYELVHWRRADRDLNYRRFFGITTLAGIRVELPDVFAASHGEITSWVREGLVDGLRVDHPDGLADPGGYLARLAAAVGGAPVWVEKILEGDEPLPAHWATAGTTGYDALATFDRVFVDPAAGRVLDALDAEVRGGVAPLWAELVHDGKRAVADGTLGSEVRRLVRDLHRDGLVERGDDDVVIDAVAELLACFPVYRSYLPLGRAHLEHAAADARRRRPELAGTIDELHALLADPQTQSAQRFQQTSGMVMAKGVEDSAFYRFTRLGTLSEVGAEPSELAVDQAELHRRNATRQASWPGALTALTTHDTKRSEDTRARITALTEIPEQWADAVRRLRRLASLDDGPLELLLWQAIVGAWPASRERLHDYATKAAREAGTSTTWTDPDEAFEARMHALVDAVFDDAEVRAVVDELVDATREAGWSNGLGLKLLQLTSPGVPDVYQGSERWCTSLVDPDNRRPVDFDAGRTLLARLDGGWLPPIDDSGAAKLLVTSRALRLRRDRPELFTSYRPMEVVGRNAEHALSFDRGGAVTVLTVRPLGLVAHGGWADTAIVLDGGTWRDVISGVVHDDGTMRLADLLASYPVALLVRA